MATTNTEQPVTTYVVRARLDRGFRATYHRYGRNGTTVDLLAVLNDDLTLTIAETLEEAVELFRARAEREGWFGALQTRSADGVWSELGTVGVRS